MCGRNFYYNIEIACVLLMKSIFIFLILFQFCLHSQFLPLYQHNLLLLLEYRPRPQFTRPLFQFNKPCPMLTKLHLQFNKPFHQHHRSLLHLHKPLLLYTQPRPLSL